MPATLDWYDDAQTILICRFDGAFDVSNYAVMEGQLPMMVREKSHRVDVILYLVPGAGLPPLQGILQEIGILINVMPANFGAFWGVGNGLLLTNILSLWVATVYLKSFYGSQAHRVHVAASLDAAAQDIHNRRASVPH